MSTFSPKEMSRNRGQVLYRYRPGQTFDHPGGFVAQVRQYGRDDAYQGAALDPGYLVNEAMNFVQRWRMEGRLAGGADAGSDRAPEFPTDDPLAHQHYEVVIPGKVYTRVWPSCSAAPRAAGVEGCGRRRIRAPEWTRGRQRAPAAATTTGTVNSNTCSFTRVARSSR